jgi:hypothetical protein
LRECGKPQARWWLWIPGSLASLAPRNDKKGVNKSRSDATGALQVL